MNNEEFLKNVRLFQDLSPRYLKALAKSCRAREYSKGDTVIRQGEPGVGMFIIVSGKVSVSKKTEEGKTFIIAEHGPGEVVGELSVIDGAVRTASITAEEDCQFLVLASWDFNSFMQNHPEVALQILPMVVKRFRETNEALIGMKVEQEKKS